MILTVEVILGGVIAVYEFLNKSKQQGCRPVGAKQRVMHGALTEE